MGIFVEAYRNLIDIIIEKDTLYCCCSAMNEILCSLHNYTKFSGYSSSFYHMAQAGLDCGLDAVISTDKNVYPSGRDQFYYLSGKRLLVICGEELFDPLSPEAPHYLSVGIGREQFNRKTGDPQDEIRVMLRDQGENNRFRHLELVNAEDFLMRDILYSQKVLRERVNDYDALLRSELRFLILAGTCSAEHTEKYTYRELFSTACNHILSDEPLNGDLVHDKLLTLQCLKSGRLYIALDGLADAKGFSFTAEGDNQESIAFPGDMIYLRSSITLKIKNPEPCTCRLIRNGTVIREWQHCKQIPFTIYEPGNYRVESSLTIRRDLYNWIFSNPIFVVKG